MARPLYLLPLLALMSGLRAAPLSVPRVPAAAVQTEESHRAFRAAFAKAQTLNALAEMQKLVKKNQPEAVSWILETAEALAGEPDDIVADRMIALRKAWRGAMDTDFAENMEKYFSLLGSREKEERHKLKTRYDAANAKYWGNSDKKDGQVYGLLSLELAGLADAFKTLGDQYFSAQCWLLRSACSGEAARGEDANLYDVCESCKRAVEAFEAIDLRGRAYIDAKNTYEYLKGQGFDRELEEAGGGEGPGPGGEGDGGAAPASGATQVSELAFELVPDVHAFERPCYYLDEVHLMWPSLDFKGNGSTAKVTGLGEASPTFLRTAAAAAGVDYDGDGALDAELPLTGNTEAMEFHIGGDEARPWGFTVRLGGTSDIYQGIKMNRAPGKDYMFLYYVPAASRVGELGGETLRVFDDNMDGVFGSPPLEWAHVGMSPGRLQPEMDSVVIGKSKRAVPYSEYMQVGDGWYKLEALENGAKLQASEVSLETGKAKLSFKGGKPRWVILRGQGRYENSFFDITSGAELPVGKYKLFYGELRKGKKQQMLKTVIIPGESTPSFEVTAGKTTTVKLGAPFGFDFTFEEDEETLTLKGPSVVVTGVAGERYERPWGCVPRPEVSWRKKGAKKGSKFEKTHVISENDEITKYGWAAAWAPLDLVLTKKGKVEDSELQLREKKNKLLGKITSDWKGN